jgi:hypothetical protein
LNQTNIRVVLTTLVLLSLLGGWSAPLEVAFFGYLIALFAREAGILWLALRGDLIAREEGRMRGPAA